MRRQLSQGTRCNLVTALGDLAFRFPNVLEPWTAHMYSPLRDPDLGACLPPLPLHSSHESSV